MRTITLAPEETENPIPYLEEEHHIPREVGNVVGRYCGVIRQNDFRFQYSGVEKGGWLYRADS